MGSYSDPALILPGAVGQTELSADSKKNVASGVAGLDASGNLQTSKLAKIGLDPVLVTDFTAGADVYHGHDAEVDTYSTEYALAKTITLDWLPSPVMRIAFDLRQEFDGHIVYGKIYRNGSPVGTEMISTIWHASTTYIENLAGWSVGDTLELYIHTNYGASRVYCKNFRILCTAAGLSNS